MADNRLARDMGTREIAQRPQAWKPPETLPTPAPQAGWVFRWVRTSLLGQFDPTNTSAKFREGWEPVKASDHPELQHTPDGSLNARFKDNVDEVRAGMECGVVLADTNDVKAGDMLEVFEIEERERTL